jgi:hypothetical protein
LVLHMSKTRGGYSKRKPLFDSLLRWPSPTLRSSLLRSKTRHDFHQFFSSTSESGLIAAIAPESHNRRRVLILPGL